METNASTPPRRRYRSLFWPFVLIGIGLIWLLVSLNVVSAENLSLLWQLWPILLIVIGLDMIFGRLSPVLGALMGILAIAIVVALLIAGPSIGLQPTATFFGLPVISFSNTEVKTERFSEPLGAAKAAQVTLDLSSAPASIHGLSDSTNLIDATLTHYGEIDFRAQGQQRKTIYLGTKGALQIGMNPAHWDRVRWDIGLSPNVPLDLSIDGGSGRADIDLADLQLSQLMLDAASGRLNLRLAAGKYAGRIEGGSGRVEIGVPAGADVDLNLSAASGGLTLNIAPNASANVRLKAGSGRVTIEVPSTAGVRFEVRDRGSGSVRVGGNLQLISDAGDDDRDTGLWETANFARADHQIIIVIADAGSGSIEVR